MGCAKCRAEHPRAAMPLCRASLQPGNAATAPPACTERLRVVWEPPARTAAAPCPPVSRGTGEGGQRCWKCQGTAWGWIMSNSSPLAKPLPQPLLSVTELLLSGLVWLRNSISHIYIFYINYIFIFKCFIFLYIKISFIIFFCSIKIFLGNSRVHKSSHKTLGEAGHRQGKVTEVHGGNQQAENLPLIHHP